jgi:hypothetical protein
MGYPWNDPRCTGAAPAFSNAQTVTVSTAPPTYWQARARAAEAREAALVTKIEEIRDVSPVGSDAHVLAIAALQETTDVG